MRHTSTAQPSVSEPRAGSGIVLENLSKSYGTHRVLTDLSFPIKSGRMTGFVGGNGAGKTTTMRILMGVLAYEGGTITVDGSPIDAQYRSRIGYMPEERGLYPKMPVKEQLVYLAKLHGVSSSQASRRSDEILERLELGARAADNLEELSLGNQQRVQVAAALVHDPVALVLDEPFSGLDPQAVDTILDVLREVAGRGAPVLFSSHQLDLVERLCDELVILANGRVAANGTRDQLLAQAGMSEWQLRTDTDTGWAREIPGISVTEFDGGDLRFTAENAETAHQLLTHAITRGTIFEFGPVHHTLHEIFHDVVQDVNTKQSSPAESTPGDQS
ncbi:ABC transporter ATP-binding protein [Auritidibacter ignavus]|uniref:ABC transporter ATP-binding protein n=1 Tax=Auritidibacter ignavus TaxID=678932 RepID=UPI00244A6570|nr:ATP-binding cassette domain-containing protein [Auritidibacter ignavus]WGH82929.1 ATP-binding cassette domain-containing protein [Auritidibacter ignavus]